MNGRWPTRLGVRSRATVAAVFVVAVALAAGTLGLLKLTGDRIESSIRDAVMARADGIVALIAAGAVEDPLPGRDPERLGQIIESSGAVIAADRAIAGVPALVEIDVTLGEERISTRDDILEGYEDEAAGLEDQGPYAIVARGVALPGGPGTVIVAASLEDAAQARNAVLPALGIGLPSLLALVGLTVWLLTGRALRPVEEMSVEAGRISALALDRRLPLPGSGDELHRLAEVLNDMLDRLEESALRRSRFVAHASHELKSPLAAMRTMVEVSAREGTPDAELLADLGGEIERIQTLVTDLLFLARHDESRPHGIGEEVDLDQVVSSVAGVLRVGSTVQLDTSGVLPVRVAGDPDRISQFVRNIMENALRHATSTVWVETARETGRATVVVSDDGPGVPAEEEGRIFERFVRLDDSRARDTGGAGLGLAVAREIVREYGGDLAIIESRHGGATFGAWFPVP